MKMFFEYLGGETFKVDTIEVKLQYNKKESVYKITNKKNNKETIAKKIHSLSFILRKYPLQSVMYISLIIFYSLSHLYMALFLFVFYGLIVWKTNLLSERYGTMEVGLGIIGLLFGVIMGFLIIYYKFEAISTYTANLEGVTMGLFIAFTTQYLYKLYNKYRNVYRIKEQDGIKYGGLIRGLYGWHA